MIETPSAYYGNSIREYIIAGSVAVATMIALLIVKKLFRRRVRKLAEATSNRFDDLLLHLVGRTKFVAIFAVGVDVGTRNLTLPLGAHALLRSLVVILLLLQLGIWASSAITFSLDDYRRRKAEEDDQSSLGAAGLLAAVAKILCWSVALLLVLDNVGVNITALVAGLGIGGIAIALAVQSTLKDLFASVSIMLDKPFEVGDSITVGKDGGKVEYIGIKTSRVRAPSGEELVFSNSDLLNSRIRNFRRLRDRRATLTIGTRYDTPLDKTATIPELLESIISDQEHTRFDRAFFTEIGASGLVFEAVYYMTETDYRLFLRTQQAINLEILRRFDEQGIQLAYPTQTVRVEKPAA